MSYNYLPVDKSALTFRQVKDFLQYDQGISITFQAHEAILKCREYLDKKLTESDELFYGINTGFGRLASDRISPDQIVQLQRNLLRSHAAGVGEPLPDSAVRGIIALRLNSLLSGRSGVRYRLLEAMQALLDKEVIPFVPSRGSVGASGDLAPLAHVALTLMGEGEAFYRGRRVPTTEAFAAAGLDSGISGSAAGRYLAMSHSKSGDAISVVATAMRTRVAKSAGVMMPR